jgi:hypothetical protein
MAEEAGCGGRGHTRVGRGRRAGLRGLGWALKEARGEGGGGARHRDRRGLGVGLALRLPQAIRVILLLDTHYSSGCRKPSESYYCSTHITAPAAASHPSHITA